MVAEGKYLCGASLHGFPVWMNNPTLFMFYLFIYLFVLLFAKYYIQDGHPPTVSVL